MAPVDPEREPAAGASAEGSAELYRRSLLIIRTQIDARGGIGGQRLGHHLFQSGYLLLCLASGRGLSCLCLGFGRAPHGLEEFLPLHCQTPPA